MGEPILDFKYNDSWYPTTDGRGFSLVVRNESAALNTWTNPASWRPSTEIHGSPGRADPAPSDISPVIITEVLTHTDPPQVDTIELHNPSSSPASLGGWFLSDNPQQPLKFCIPTNVVLAPGGYALLSESDYNAGGAGFALSSLGEEVYLFSGNGTNITGYRHGFEFGAQLNGVTFGRFVTSDGKEHVVTEKAETLGFANAGPKVGPVVINEIMYAPVPFGADPDQVDEYIELRNYSRQAVPLYDDLHPTNAWRVGGGVQFTFPADVILAPWEYVLVVPFDPEHDPGSANWFRSRYGLAESVRLLGPWQGSLNNSGEGVGLYLPDKPELPPSPVAGFSPYVLVEEVTYSDQSPWPQNAHGSGNSIERIDAAAFGNEPLNWRGSAPTPAAVNFGALQVDHDQDSLPDEWEIAHGLDPLDPLGNQGGIGDGDEDGLNNFSEYVAGTDPNDREDLLGFSSVYVTGENCVLEFTPRAGRLYGIEKSSDLTGSWMTVWDNISGTTEVMRSEPLGATPTFYRLRARIAP